MSRLSREVVWKRYTAGRFGACVRDTLTHLRKRHGESLGHLFTDEYDPSCLFFCTERDWSDDFGTWLLARLSRLRLFHAIPVA